MSDQDGADGFTGSRATRGGPTAAEIARQGLPRMMGRGASGAAMGQQEQSMLARAPVRSEVEYEMVELAGALNAVNQTVLALIDRIEPLLTASSGVPIEGDKEAMPGSEFGRRLRAFREQAYALNRAASIALSGLAL